MFELWLGPLYNAGWNKSEEPSNSIAICEHCGVHDYCTKYPLTKKVYIVSQDTESGFTVDKYCMVVHCNRCGNERMIEATKKHKRKAVIEVNPLVLAFSKLSENEQKVLLEKFMGIKVG